VCCVGPLLLLALGIGGAWVGSLTKMEPFRPYFIVLTLLFLGLAFRKLYTPHLLDCCDFAARVAGCAMVRPLFY
jgi:MerT mercuric transport protein